MPSRCRPGQDGEQQQLGFAGNASDQRKADRRRRPRHRERCRISTPPSAGFRRIASGSRPRRNGRRTPLHDRP